MARPRSDELLEALAVQPGVCAFCGCSDHEPCIDKDGDGCSWVNEEHTVCSSCADDLGTAVMDELHRVVTDGDNEPATDAIALAVLDFLTTGEASR